MAQRNFDTSWFATTLSVSTLFEIKMHGKRFDVLIKGHRCTLP